MTPPPAPASIRPVIAVVVFAAILPFLLTGGFQIRLAMLVWIYAILCMGFNLLYGFTGQISLGQQTFFAAGAYGFALLQAKAGWSMPAAFAGGLVLCAALALAIGIPLLRLRTHYLAMATLAFGLIFYGVTIRWIDFTGGSAGLAVQPLTIAGRNPTRLEGYYLVLALASLVLLLHDFVIRTHLGRSLQAIRDDETAAAALGVDVTRNKLRIFVLAAVLAGLAGIAFALVGTRVDPSMSEFHVLVTMLTVSVVGGLGTRFGPVLGSAIVVVLPQVLASVGEYETLLYGAFILVFLIFLPHGLAGLVEGEAFARLFRRPPRGGTAPRPTAAPVEAEREVAR